MSHQVISSNFDRWVWNGPRKATLPFSFGKPGESSHIERDSSIKYPIETRYAMSDDEDKYVIEIADAGASDTIPCEAGAIKKGG